VKVRIKIQHDPDWRPNLRLNQRYWVHLSDGNYLPIFSGHCGQWYQLYAQHMDYPSFEAALADALRYLYAKYDKLEQWRKCRATVQVFTFNDRKHSRIKVPRERKPAQSKPARKA
jgi:hypothetical protein